MNTRDLLIGAALGSAATLLLDPSSGRRRRSLIGNQVTRASRKTRDGMGAATRDLSNRARGLAANVRGRIRSEEVDDETLIERVRARLGRVCSHPRAIDVIAHDGTVTLRGPILAAEVTPVLGMAAAVRGVHEVINELEPHGSSEHIPSLQGEGRAAGWDISPRRWSPATRTLVGAGVVAGAVAARQLRRQPTEWH